MPSIGPGSWPCSFNACWTRFTSSLPAVMAPDREEEDIPEEDDPAEDVSEDAEPDEDMPVSLDRPLWALPVPVRLPWLTP